MNTKTRRLKKEKSERDKCSCRVDKELKKVYVCHYCREMFSFLNDWKPNGYQIL